MAASTTNSINFARNAYENSESATYTTQQKRRRVAVATEPAGVNQRKKAGCVHV